MPKRRSGREKMNSIHLNLVEVEPLTPNQVIAFESDKCLFLHGCAGTGKTFISLYLAFRDVLTTDKYNQVEIIRSAVPTREMGFLPGTDAEKARVYETPYINISHELFDRGDAYELLKSKNLISFNTTSFIRGTTFNDSIVIVDECQNMTFHELDSIITRVGKNCKIIFCGDFFQSDLQKNSGISPFIDIVRHMNSFDFIEFGIEDIVRSDFVKHYLITKYNFRAWGQLSQK